MALFDGFGRLNVGGGQALLKIEHEERAELATHDGYTSSTNSTNI